MIRLNLKTKLFFGFGFLFFMIVLIWIISTYFIYDLSNRSSAMLKENYETVESTKFLLQSIDEIKNQQLNYYYRGEVAFNESLYNSNLEIFRKHLIAAANNITEDGEQVVVEQLTQNFQQYIASFERLKTMSEVNADLFMDELIPQFSSTRNLIVSLWDMNMDAIRFKNSLLKASAQRAFVLTSVIGLICFIISALFLFKYPKNIANPIGELLRGITEIANRNYSKRLDFHSNDELGELAKAFNVMAAKLDEYEHSNLSELLFEKRRIDTIINTMNDGIIGLNEKNQIIFSNTNACNLITYEQSALVGKNASDVANSNSVFHTIISDILNNTNREIFEFKPLRITSNVGVEYYAREVLDVRISKTGENELVRAGIVIVLKNITHFLEQDEAKTNFIATISHELKTPLSSLKLNLRLLEDKRIGALNHEQTEIVSALQLETRKMLSITSELLDLAQVETGKINFRIEPCEVNVLFDSIRETSENLAKSRKIKLNYSSSPGNIVLLCDQEKTALVLMNLISNAINYSKKESSINITAIQKINEVVITVQDFGRGIAPEYQTNIFDKFFKVPGSADSGTGLGLAICKEFVNRQKGEIWFESEPNVGSSFHISLPV